MQREFYPSIYAVAVVGFAAVLHLCGYSAGVTGLAASAFAIVFGALMVRNVISELP
jgi:hypothetical protein